MTQTNHTKSPLFEEDANHEFDALQAVSGATAQEMELRDPKKEKVAVCVMDGEKALKNHAGEQLQQGFPGLVLILDIIHVIEYLWKAAYAFCKEGSEEAKEWVRERLLAILQGKVSDVVEQMKEKVLASKLGEAGRKAVDAACGYFSKDERGHSIKTYNLDVESSLSL